MSLGTVARRCLMRAPSQPSLLSMRRTITSTTKNENAVVTLNPGDGVGPDLMQSVKEVFKAISVPVEFDEHLVSEVQNRASEQRVNAFIESIKKNKVVLMGDIASPINDYGGELKSLKLQIRRDLNVFANVVRIQSLPGLETRHNNLDFVVIREQLEGEYSGVEHEVVPGVTECLKIITRKKSYQVAKFAFDYATKHGRKKVTAVHKANIMKEGDGLFLQTCRDVAELYPKIELETMIVDNTCMQLVQNPYQFDVMVMPNLYGNIIENAAAGLVGGAGVVPGESFSHEYAIFEPGARHIYSHALGRNIANPTAMLLSSANMLKHIRLTEYGTLIENSIKDVLKTER